jgi:protein-S-isoprenylcysteine O-methyltransferase Ste14
MELFPALKLGWINGWLMLASFYLVFGFMLLLSPRAVVKRLYDVPVWNSQQRVLSLMGTPFSLACITLIVFTPLKISQAVFMAGLVVFAVGFAGMISALIVFRRTPLDQLVTGGLYRISRNPQWVSLCLMILGTGIAIGSWTVVLLLLVIVVFTHFRILGEERSCAKRYGEPYQEFLQRVPRYLLFV